MTHTAASPSIPLFPGYQPTGTGCLNFDHILVHGTTTGRCSSADLNRSNTPKASSAVKIDYTLPFDLEAEPRFEKIFIDMYVEAQDHPFAGSGVYYHDFVDLINGKVKQIRVLYAQLYGAGAVREFPVFDINLDAAFGELFDALYLDTADRCRNYDGYGPNYLALLKHVNQLVRADQELVRQAYQGL